MRLGRLAAACTQSRRDAPLPASAATLAQVSGRGVLVINHSVHQHRADMVAGLFCAFSFALSGLAIARQPGLLALVAARMTAAHRTLAGVAVIVATLAFFFGMIVAISTDNPLF